MIRTILAAMVVGAACLTLPSGVGGAQTQVPSAFTWRMADRFGATAQTLRGPDGLPAYRPVVTPSREYIHSPDRTVVLDACAAERAETATYAWRIDDEPRVVAGCRYQRQFAGRGRHEVELTVTEPSGRSTSSTQVIDLKEYLIVSLGDSYASGEGNPEVPGAYTVAFPPCWQGARLNLTRPCVQGVVRPAAWTADACHRSSWAGPAQAGLALEQDDPHSTVTFVSLACSGATIEEGLLGRQVNRPPDRPPQVITLAELLCPPSTTCTDASARTRIDVLIISIGGNDVGFSDIVKACVTLVGRCTGDGVPDDSPVAQARPKLLALGLHYVHLFRTINATFEVGTVLLTENADVWTGEFGQPCRIGGFPLGAGIHSEDVQWLHENLLRPLNAAEANIARTFGWIFVGGIADAFRGHGYCAADPWVVTYPDSWSGQGDDRGTLHPNAKGHRLYSQRILDAVRVALLP